MSHFKRPGAWSFLLPQTSSFVESARYAGMDDIESRKHIGRFQHCWRVGSGDRHINIRFSRKATQSVDVAMDHPNWTARSHITKVQSNSRLGVASEYRTVIQRLPEYVTATGLTGQPGLLQEIIPIWPVPRVVVPGIFKIATRVCLPDVVHLEVARREVSGLEREVGMAQRLLTEIIQTVLVVRESVLAGASETANINPVFGADVSRAVEAESPFVPHCVASGTQDSDRDSRPIM
ncbi:hypothetical protein EDB89DRAFT_1905512 [Lactarius sanguifluus]|nr:hypothetical protein EDB89DRAFT_1905512 [Lactarius sanguifluus]